MRFFILLACALAVFFCRAEEQSKQGEPPKTTAPKVDDQAKPDTAPKPGDKPSPAGSKDAPESLAPVTVTAPEEKAQAAEQGRSADLVKVAQSASQGYVGAKQLEDRPTSRPGEVLETVPGMITTQHSGEGKANQYFFRGFNLDHGTDFATWVDDMPVNMRTHAHGHGYTDLNFLIPELISSVEYKKGPIYADEGDFAATGAAHIEYAKSLDHNTAEIMEGSFNHQRALYMGGTQYMNGNIISALELEHNDGPFDHSESVHKISGVLGYSKGDAELGFSVTAMAYYNQWNSTDQIPERAVNEHIIDRLGAIDPSDGGNTQRYSLNAEWHRTDKDSSTKFNVYGEVYKLKLYNDFTFFQDDPVNGDQFEQSDRREMYGFNASHTLYNEICGRRVESTFGLQNRNDDIDVGLFHTKDRDLLSITRADRVFESNISPYVEENIQWHDKLRTVTGCRYDLYDFNVRSINPENSGNLWRGTASPKASIIMGPWSKTEFYLNYGWGFHSNDARGVFTTEDPSTGDELKKSPPLVRAKGEEVGVRTTWIPHLNSSLAVFALDLDSELVFSGDAGTTEPSRASRRLGAEFANYYTPLKWLTFDFDYSRDHGRFRDAEPTVGRFIPGAVTDVLATGISIDHKSGWFGGIRARYFGPRPLIEDGSRWSNSTLLFNGRVGYHFNKNWKVTLEGFNLFNSKEHDIDYYYSSQLKNEKTPVNDFHFHPVEPVQGRLSLTYTW